MKTFRGHTLGINCLGLFKDIIVTGSDDKHVLAWKFTNREASRSIKESPKNMKSASAPTSPRDDLQPSPTSKGSSRERSLSASHSSSLLSKLNARDSQEFLPPNTIGLLARENTGTIREEGENGRSMSPLATRDDFIPQRVMEEDERPAREVYPGSNVIEEATFALSPLNSWKGKRNPLEALPEAPLRRNNLPELPAKKLTEDLPPLVKRSSLGNSFKNTSAVQSLGSNSRVRPSPPPTGKIRSLGEALLGEDIDDDMADDAPNLRKLLPIT